MTRDFRAPVASAAVAFLLAAVVCAAPVSAAGPHYQEAGATGTVQPSKAQRYYMSGVELMNNSRYLDAAEQFRLAIDEDSEYIDSYRNLAFVYTKMAATEAEYNEDALEIYEQLETMLPEDVDVKKNKAYVFGQLGELGEAVATYEEIVELAPEDCDAWGRLGQLHKTVADAAGEGTDKHAAEMMAAIDAYKSLIAACPEEIGAFNTLGELYFALKKTDEAAAVYTSLLEKDPGNVDIAGRLAYLWYQAQEWEKSLPLFEKVLELDAQRQGYRGLYAEALKKAGKSGKAADQYMKIIEEDPTKRNLYCNLGFTYLDAGEYEKAIEMAMKAIADNAPDQACLYCVWAKGLENRGTRQVNVEFQYDRGMSTYTDAKAKFTLALGDAKWGDYAAKQITRQDQLIERAKQLKLKNDQ